MSMRNRIGLLAKIAMSGGALLTLVAAACRTAPEGETSNVEEKTAQTLGGPSSCNSTPAQTCQWVCGCNGLPNYPCLPVNPGGPNCGCMCNDNAQAGPVEIAAGGNDTYAIDSMGGVWGWGHAGAGELAGAVDASASTGPVALNITSAKHISAGDQGGCALMQDGTVQCWGVVSAESSTVTWTSPAAVQDGPSHTMTGVTAITQSGTHACALKSDKSVWCWGDNVLGQCGDGTTTNHATAAVAVIDPNDTTKTIQDATQVVAGGNATCILRGSGVVVCFGSNKDGELGVGTKSTGANSTPKVVQNFTGATALFGGGGGYPPASPNSPAAARAGTFCADTASTTWCWGFNHYGETGEPAALDSEGHPITPADMPSPSFFTFSYGQMSPYGSGKHAIGFLAACNHAPQGAGECWGVDDKGELSNGSGIGSTRYRTDATWSPDAAAAYGPIQLANTFDAGASIQQIAIGYQHMCALSGTTVFCWGDDSYGQMGASSLGATPQAVPAFGTYYSPFQ